MNAMAAAMHYSLLHVCNALSATARWPLSELDSISSRGPCVDFDCRDYIMLSCNARVRCYSEARTDRVCGNVCMGVVGVVCVVVCVGEVEVLGCVCASGGLKVDCNGHVLVTYSQCEYFVGGQEVVVRAPGMLVD